MHRSTWLFFIVILAHALPFNEFYTFEFEEFIVFSMQTKNQKYCHRCPACQYRKRRITFAFLCGIFVGFADHSASGACQ